VPFTWRDATTGEERPMEAVAGLVGMTQDANTLALRPKVGWAVREADKLDALLRRVSAEHITRPGVNVGGPRPEEGVRAREHESDSPPALGRFYPHTNGADLFGDALRILPVGSVEPADWAGIHRGLRFATLRDGSFFVLSPEQGLEYPGRYDPMFRPVAYCRPDNVSKPGRNPVVALSFTELLQRVLDGGRGQDWLAEAGAKYGDANHYVRS